tara:strand:- start:341 stop:1804 length:1464 start_codon:yes stop_codon:yes gene_type:complete
MQVDTTTSPSISYLSLIETGRRFPSQKLLDLLASIFQKEISWFIDDSIRPESLKKGEDMDGTNRLRLEPGVLFTKDLLEISIPELLSQANIHGRQFAHVLIRAYQEKNQNQFPDLERIADEISKKRFPLTANQLLKLVHNHGLKIKWFNKHPFKTTDDEGFEVNTFFRSFFEPPNTVFINSQLQIQKNRLKYELALHLAHMILHGGDGILSNHATGGQLGGSPRPSPDQTSHMTQQDILIAWRDFECSFFAGALLCPRQPFRRFLTQKGYDIFAGDQIHLTPSVVMRRMTSVSPYRFWHYFDVYPPNHLRAVYRGNGISLPWGTISPGEDPCQHWAIFKLASDSTKDKTSAQLSLLKNYNRSNLYACIATTLKDASGNKHIVSVGIDLAPMMESHGLDSGEIISEIDNACNNNLSKSKIPKSISQDILSASRVLNIGWIEDCLENYTQIICPRSSVCPRHNKCVNATKNISKQLNWVNEIKKEILSN